MSNLKMKIRNKKGEILMKEVVRIVLSLLVITVLIYLAYQLYGLLINKPEIEQARATLDGIAGKIEILNEDEEINYLVVAPKGWSLSGFSKETETRPLSCQKNIDCICICKNPGKLRELELPNEEDCNKMGICKEFGNKNIKVYRESTFTPGEGFENILLDVPLALLLSRKENIYTIMSLVEKESIESSDDELDNLLKFKICEYNEEIPDTFGNPTFADRCPPNAENVEDVLFIICSPNGETYNLYLRKFMEHYIKISFEDKFNSEKVYFVSNCEKELVALHASQIKNEFEARIDLEGKGSLYLPVRTKQLEKDGKKINIKLTSSIYGS